MNMKRAEDTHPWAQGEPFTLFSESDGNMVCPAIARLPCGDLLVTCNRDGDYPLSRVRTLRSVDGGGTWREDDLHQDLLPVKSLVMLDDGLVRLYGEAVDIKGTEGQDYLYFYCDSADGGRTFSEIKTGRYTLPEGEQPGPTIQESAFWGVHLNLAVYRRALLEAAGWRMPRRSPGMGNPECFEARLRGPHDSSQRWLPHLKLADGSALSFVSACTVAEKADPRHWESSLLALVSHDRGVSWQSHGVAAPYRAGSFPYEGYAHAACLQPWEHGYCEASAVQLADGRVYVVMRSGGGGVPLCHVWSADGGRTWTAPRPIDRRVCGVAPTLLKLADGTLALCHGRPGIYVMFDPSGTGEQWDVDNRFDLTGAERLTVETNARPFANRPDCDALMDHVNAPRATLDWAKPEVLNAHYYSWENVDMCEVDPGRILVVYDLQNWIEKPGVPHRNAIRGVWLAKPPFAAAPATGGGGVEGRR